MKKIFIMLLVCFVVLSGLIIHHEYLVIFQKGNPLPYITKMIQLNDNKTFEKVSDQPLVFITKKGKFHELKNYIENSYNVTFFEQMGCAYTFKGDNITFTGRSEVYWSYYDVYTFINTP